MLVYKVTNKINGKSYIGQTTKSLKIRKRNHLWCALNERNNYCFYNAIRKYGSESFDWEIMAEGICSQETLNELEKHFICLYNTYHDGYNSTLGGGTSIGFRHSEKTKKKMSIMRKGKLAGKKHPFYGKKFTEEHRKKLSETHKGKKLSVETRKKMSKFQKNKVVSEETRRKISKAHIGIRPSEETKRKMSTARKGRFVGKDSPLYGRKLSEEHKRNISKAGIGKQVGKNNPSAKAVIINSKYFDTVNEAAKDMNVTRLTIYRRIRRGTVGYQYAHKEEN
jgi:group I intron endonuclease